MLEAWKRREKLIRSITFGSVPALVRTSGIYALGTMATPLVSLLLAPFLTRHLSAGDYGLLVVINTGIGLVAGLTQLGVGSAFFRAYNYDYSSRKDRASVLATAYGLMLAAAVIVLFAGLLVFGRWTAGSGRTSGGVLAIVAAAVVAVQNLSVPAMAFMRAEGRAGWFAGMSIAGVIVTLLCNVLLVGVLGLGVLGSLVATGLGFAFLVLATSPLVIQQLGMLRLDVARNLLGFGLPQVPNVLAMWVLQLSDRYILAALRSFDETARYAVAYSLGLAVSIAIVSPFALAWPAAMYSIAKRADARSRFRVVFAACFLLFLFSGFALSMVGLWLLDWLFPVTYRSAGTIIPLIAESMVFYGAYVLLTVGISLTRKTWLASALTLGAAATNVALNLLLVPTFGATGAALATLLAYIGLASAAYFVNQRLFPIDLPVGRLVASTLAGMVIYVGGYAASVAVPPVWRFPVQALGLVVFLGYLVPVAVSIVLPAVPRGSFVMGGGSAVDRRR